MLPFSALLLAAEKIIFLGGGGLSRGRAMQMTWYSASFDREKAEKQERYLDGSATTLQPDRKIYLYRGGATPAFDEEYRQPTLHRLNNSLACAQR